MYGVLSNSAPAPTDHGIVERDTSVLAVDQTAEIALAHGVGPDSGGGGAGLALPHLFPGGEEEGPVLAVVDLGDDTPARPPTRRTRCEPGAGPW